MLEEFVHELKQVLAQRIEHQRDLTESESQTINRDAARGRIQGFKQAIIDIDELVARYAEPESVPEHLQTYGQITSVNGLRESDRRRQRAASRQGRAA